MKYSQCEVERYLREEGMSEKHPADWYFDSTLIRINFADMMHVFDTFIENVNKALKAKDKQIDDFLLRYEDFKAFEHHQKTIENYVKE